MPLEAIEHLTILLLLNTENGIENDMIIINYDLLYDLYDSQL